MVPFSLCPSSSYPPSSSFKLYHKSQVTVTTLSSQCGRKRRSGSSCRLVVLSTHSNPKILKSNRRSRYGQPLSPYDQDDDEEVSRPSDVSDDDWLLNDDFAEISEFDVNRKRSKSHKGFANGHSDGRNSKHTLEKSNAANYYNSSNQTNGVSSLDVPRKGKLSTRKAMEDRFPRLSEEVELDEKWLPLIDYLSTFGLKESHFIQMYERHMPSLQINACSAKERLEYLLSVGVKQRDVRRMLLRQPQILEYTVENNLKSHVAFLMSLGIPSSRVGQIIAAAPSLFSYSVENSLKPTVRYLVEEFLHYSIDDGLLPRINFLRSIGMCNADILKVLTSLTQVLSLSLEENLKPKYKYLVNELHNEVHSLTKYPMYLSLSLDQRIRPRHRFLLSLKKAPKGPFPLSSLVPTDECFCQQWAGTSLDKYLDFRQRLLLKEFAKKYERKG
ncbi:uncharacterized protein Pyn_04049 [Prunus yedoensis var. nudiflora]|uniref:Uncharacterized protein n=1 Tax=Prunus yedoensis var. nudiflora TaxID=2094558 RepID=A0A314UEX8_PRUYE|nr:uncharacterized protein Pyn_04049 [Prunus yedoensis var. nudiflora]